MLYFDDFSGVSRFIRSNTAFFVCDKDFIFKTFEAITRKEYFEARGVIKYTDSTSDYSFETEMSRSGFSNISSLLREPLCNKFPWVKECSLELDFIYKYPGEYSRRNKSRAVRLWYNSTTERMYLSENAKRLLYMPDTLPSVSYELEDMLGDVTFENASYAGIDESYLSFVSKYVRFFNEHTAEQLMFSGNFFSWPAPPRVAGVLPYLNEDKMQKSVALGVLQDGEWCLLTGEDISSNILSSNALGIQHIYSECTDAVTRATWDGTEVCAVPVAMDSVKYIERCLGAGN